MAGSLYQRKSATRKVKPLSSRRVVRENGFPAATVRILDTALASILIQDRQQRGIDLYDEVWEGVYVMPPMPNLPHQGLVQGMATIFEEVVTREGKGRVYPGANVSDRQIGWQDNYRVPDVLVVLNNSRAVDCTTHLWGGPDFLMEVQSPGDDTEAKIPFYSQIQVHEHLVIQRDTRRLVLYRHDARQLRPVQPVGFRAGKWLLSEVLPLAFRRLARRSGTQIVIQRTDEKPGLWLI